MAKKGFFGRFRGKEEDQEKERAEAREKAMEDRQRQDERKKMEAKIREQQEERKRMKADMAKKEPEVKKHVVVSGDTLSGIAKKYYDDAGKYMIIYEANKEVIGGDPNLIQPGMELLIPDVKE